VAYQPRSGATFTDPGTFLEAHNITIDWGGATEDGDVATSVPAGQTTLDYPLPQYLGSCPFCETGAA
jgi:hypothetical protein